jgi:hypothetical protein
LGQKRRSIDRNKPYGAATSVTLVL